jgi:hypothetical protein
MVLGRKTEKGYLNCTKILREFLTFDDMKHTGFRGLGGSEEALWQFMEKED